MCWSRSKRHEISSADVPGHIDQTVHWNLFICPPGPQAIDSQWGEGLMKDCWVGEEWSDLVQKPSSPILLLIKYLFHFRLKMYLSNCHHSPSQIYAEIQTKSLSISSKQTENIWPVKNIFQIYFFSKQVNTKDQASARISVLLSIRLVSTIFSQQ